MNGKGKRYNKGKNRLDLISPFAQEGLGEVLSNGANKYGARNWEKGMPWSNVISSLKRHLLEIEKGNDFDKESGLLHIDHVQANAMFLSHYYKTYPEGDDRIRNDRNLRIGLDIDGVIADFNSHFDNTFPTEEKTLFWNSYNITDNFSTIEDDYVWWLKIPRLIDPEEIDFEPVVYITARPIASDVTEEWLRENNFPSAPVETVGRGESKLEIAKKYHLDRFVDDNYDNFVELNHGGVFTFLMDRSYNKIYDVGIKRIKSLKEIF